MTKEELTAMTHDQRRDWLATKYGWRHIPGSGWWCHPNWGGRPTACQQIPDTLDAIAAAMPEGWVWWRCNGLSGQYWSASKRNEWGNRRRVEVHADDTGDEKYDRLLLACLAWLENEKEAK